MSDTNDALTGAEAAPAPEEIVQDTPQTPAPVETDEQRDERERDEKGRFVQKRINELTREKHEARRQAESLRQELESLRREVHQVRQPAPDPQDDPFAYAAHIAEQRVTEVLSQREAEWAKQQEQQRFQSIAEQYATREEAYAAQNPDYSEAVDQLIGVMGRNPMLAEVLMVSEHGPAVAHYLGQHLDEASRIAQMPAHIAAAHIGRLEARLSAPKPKPVTAAPAPAPTVGGGSAASKSPDRMTTEEWMAWRTTQRR